MLNYRNNLRCVEEMAIVMNRQLPKVVFTQPGRVLEKLGWLFGLILLWHLFLGKLEFGGTIMNIGLEKKPCIKLAKNNKIYSLSLVQAR